MSWSRNIRHTGLGILDRGPPTHKVSDTASVHSKQDVCGDTETSFGSPSGIAKDHLSTDDQEAAMAPGSSSRRSMA